MSIESFAKRPKVEDQSESITSMSSTNSAFPTAPTIINTSGWTCPSCAKYYSSQVKSCTICNKQRPDIPYHIDVHITFEGAMTQIPAIFLKDLKLSCSVAYLSDLIEINSNVARQSQIIVHN